MTFQPNSGKRKVALITDDPMLKIAVQHLLGTEQEQFELQTSFTYEALDERPDWEGIDLALADISRRNNIEQLRRVRVSVPSLTILGWCAETLMAITNEIRQLCNGVISRRAGREDLLAALRGSSGLAITSSLTTRTKETNISLTYRESQLVTLLARGYKNKEISECLGITPGTVKVYLSTLFKKTGAKDRMELALFGIKNSVYGQAEKSGPVPILVAERRVLSKPLLNTMRLVSAVVPEVVCTVG